MKRQLTFLCMLLSFLAVVALLAGCGGDEDKTVDYENPFDWEYTPEFEGTYDDDMKIDGVLDEAVWTSPARKWMTFSEGDATVWHKIGRAHV